MCKTYKIIIEGCGCLTIWLNDEPIHHGHYPGLYEDATDPDRLIEWLGNEELIPMLTPITFSQIEDYVYPILNAKTIEAVKVSHE